MSEERNDTPSPAEITATAPTTTNDTAPTSNGNDTPTAASDVHQDAAPPLTFTPEEATVLAVAATVEGIPVNNVTDTHVPTGVKHINKETLDRYKTIVDIFTGYLQVALTANIWFYALTGAVVSYFLTHRDEHYLAYALILPFILGLQLASLSYRGIAQALMMERPVSNILQDMVELKEEEISELQAKAYGPIEKLISKVQKWKKERASNSNGADSTNTVPVRIEAVPVRILTGFLVSTSVVSIVVCIGLVILFLLSIFGFLPSPPTKP